MIPLTTYHNATAAFDYVDKTNLEFMYGLLERYKGLISCECLLAPRSRCIGLQNGNRGFMLGQEVTNNVFRMIRFHSTSYSYTTAPYSIPSLFQCRSLMITIHPSRRHEPRQLIPGFPVLFLCFTLSAAHEANLLT